MNLFDFDFDCQLCSLHLERETRGRSQPRLKVGSDSQTLHPPPGASLDAMQNMKTKHEASILHVFDEAEQAPHHAFLSTLLTLTVQTKYVYNTLTTTNNTFLQSPQHFSVTTLHNTASGRNSSLSLQHFSTLSLWQQTPKQLSTLLTMTRLNISPSFSNSPISTLSTLQSCVVHGTPRRIAPNTLRLSPPLQRRATRNHKPTVAQRNGPQTPQTILYLTWMYFSWAKLFLWNKKSRPDFTLLPRKKNPVESKSFQVFKKHSKTWVSPRASLEFPAFGPFGQVLNWRFGPEEWQRSCHLSAWWNLVLNPSLWFLCTTCTSTAKFKIHRLYIYIYM